MRREMGELEMERTGSARARERSDVRSEGRKEGKRRRKEEELTRYLQRRQEPGRRTADYPRRRLPQPHLPSYAYTHINFHLLAKDLLCERQQRKEKKGERTKLPTSPPPSLSPPPPSASSHSRPPPYSTPNSSPSPSPQTPTRSRVLAGLCRKRGSGGPRLRRGGGVVRRAWRERRRSRRLEGRPESESGRARGGVAGV